MSILIPLLRVIHVVGAVIWAGAGIYNVAFLNPAVEQSGPAGRTVMQRIAGGSLPKVLSVVPLLVVGSGLVMYWFYSNHFSVGYMTSVRGIVLTIGVLTGVAAFLEGLLVTGPAANKLGQLGQKLQQAEGPPDPELLAQLQTTQERLGKATIRSAIFLVVALVTMSWGAA